MIPPTLILRKTNIFYHLKKGGEKHNNLLLIDDLKLFVKNEIQLEGLVYTVRIPSEDIKLEFIFSKSASLEMKRGKVLQREGIVVPNGEMVKCVEEEKRYKYLGLLEVDEIKQVEIKEFISKKYFRRMRVILKSKLNDGNIISAINSWPVSLIRYASAMIEWKKQELQLLHRKKEYVNNVWCTSS